MGKSSRNKRKKGSSPRHGFVSDQSKVSHYFKSNKHDQVFVPRKPETENAQTIEEAILDSTPSVEHTHSQTIRDFDKEHSHPIKQRIELNSFSNVPSDAVKSTSVYRHQGINGERLRKFGSGNLSFKEFDKVVQGKYRKWGIKYGKDGSSYARNYADYHDNMESARTNPRTKFYLDWLTSSQILRRSPWQAEGERLLARLQLGSVIDDGSNDPAFPWFVQTLDNDKHQLEISELQVTNTNAISHPHTSTFLFRDAVLKTAFSMPLPKHTITTDLLPLDSMFWVFEMPVPIAVVSGQGGDNQDQESIQTLQDLISDKGSAVKWVGTDGKEYPSSTALVDWLLLWRGLNAINITMSMRGVSNTVNLQMRYEDGEIYDQTTGAITHLIFSILAFINTPMIYKAKEENPRRVRKQLERLKKKNGDNHKDTIQTSVVYLRRPQAKKSTGDGAEKRKRDFQWWVSGHYRSQWYGSTGTHKLIWISPFLKGEQGMPVRDITYMVVR